MSDIYGPDKLILTPARNVAQCVDQLQRWLSFDQRLAMLETCERVLVSILHWRQHGTLPLKMKPEELPHLDRLRQVWASHYYLLVRYTWALALVTPIGRDQDKLITWLSSLASVEEQRLKYTVTPFFDRLYFSWPQIVYDTHEAIMSKAIYTVPYHSEHHIWPLPQPTASVTNPNVEDFELLLKKMEESC